MNGDPAIIRKIKALHTIRLPFIVLGELYYGAYKSTKSKQNVAKIKAFIDGYCEVYYPTDTTLEIYGQLKRSLSKKGKPIPENDIWIAAIAQEYDYALITRDQHFGNVDTLKTAEW